MKVKCLLCVDHSDNDIGYVQCRLLKGVICYACCIEISHGAEDTREEVMKRLNLTTEDEIDKACGNCKQQWVKKDYRQTGKRLGQETDTRLSHHLKLRRTFAMSWLKGTGFL